MKEVNVFMRHIRNHHYCAYITIPSDVEYGYDTYGEAIDWACNLDEITYEGTVKDFIDKNIIPIDCNGMFDNPELNIIGFDFNHLHHEEMGVFNDFEWCKKRTLEMYRAVKEYCARPKVPIPHFYVVSVTSTTADGECRWIDDAYFEELSAAKIYTRQMFYKYLSEAIENVEPEINDTIDGINFIAEDNDTLYIAQCIPGYFKGKQVYYKRVKQEEIN